MNTTLKEANEIMGKYITMTILGYAAIAGLTKVIVAKINKPPAQGR